MKFDNENFAKIKSFFEKYKLFIGLGVVSALLFLCPFVEKMWIAVSVVLGLFMFTCSVDEIFVVMMFMMPFSGLDSLYVITIIIALVVVLAKYIIDVIRKQKQICWFPLLTTVLIVILSTLKSFVVGERKLETGMLLIFVFALCYFAFVYRKDISVSKCFNALLCGLFVSAGITLVLSRFEEFKYFIRSYEGYYMRLKMTTFHINNLALLCLFEFAYSIHSLLNRSRKIWIEFISIVFMMVLGVLTLSKVFLVTIAFFVFYFIIALVIKLKTKAIKYLLVVVGIVIALCIAGKSYIADIFDRMFLYNKGGSVWNEILNGRVEIWKDYLADFKSSWHNKWFGVGLFRPNFEFDPHNAYIFVLHRFGVIGILFILVLIASYVISAKPKFKFDFCKILLIITWIIIGLEETVLSDQFTIFLILGLMLLFENEQKKKVVFVSENAESSEAETRKQEENNNKTNNKEDKSDKKDANKTDKNDKTDDVGTNRYKPKKKVKVKYTQLSNK